MEGLLNQDQYRKILNDEMLPSAQNLFGSNSYIFQQDNDPKHTAKLTRKWFGDNGVTTLDWPAQSPDVNPIENLWSQLDRNLKLRAPKHENELFEVLQKGWNDLSTSYVEGLS